MEFALPPEVEAFRQEVAEFIREEWPEEYRRRSGELSEDLYEEERKFRQKLGAKGWLSMHWPAEYGGQGRSALDYYVFHDEMAYHGAPGGSTATGIVAPTLLRFGTEDQRSTFLPRIASGELEFCLGYSEPDAGSDLASLQIRAEEDGDFFVINGIKRWTSQAHRSEYCWLAARTDPNVPKHKGISLFMVDMSTPGITVKPIHTMGGIRTNETYWEDVRVPRSNLVGEVDRGWYYVAAALDFERMTVFPVGRFRSAFERLVEAIKERDGLKDDPRVRERIGRLSAELEATQMFSYRTAWLVSNGEIPNYEASMLKMFGTEAHQRMSHLGTEILGLAAQLRQGENDAPADGEIEHEYRSMVMPTFGGGASELQRNIIATRGMGLPRG